MLKIISQRSSRSIARVRIALQTASDDCFKVTVERRYKRTQTGRRSRGSLMNNIKNIRAHEWWPASKEVKQNRAQTVNVCCTCEIGCSTLSLLGRDVTRCSKCLQRSG